MEWTIPIQKFEVNKVHLGALSNHPKLMIPLNYHDHTSKFPQVSILLPSLTVKSYDLHTGRLILSLEDAPVVSGKLQSLQEKLLFAIQQNQNSWFAGPSRSNAELRNGFQPMFESNSLHVYCPSVVGAPNHEVSIQTGGMWQKGIREGMIRAGDRLRIALRIQGISFHTHPLSEAWTGKFRLQHRIVTVLHA